VSRTYSVEPWVVDPLKGFVAEADARMVLLMTPAGQVIAQYGFTRAVDVMAAAALGAAIVSAAGAVARMLDEPVFSALNHQGKQHGIFLAGFDTPRGRMVVLVVYGRESSPGLVQLFFEEFARELVAKCPEPEAPKPILAKDFERDLNETLNALFRA